MITLAIDTSTLRGSVALLVDSEFVLSETFVADRTHSASLFTTLEKARALVPTVDQVAIGLGPGSFAGVRIAIAAALGLQLALGCRLIGIPSAAVLDTTADEFLVIGDARREAFYFTRVHDGVCMEGPLLASESELRARIEARGAAPVFATGTLAGFPEVQIGLPSAEKLARLSAAGRGIVQQDEIEPIYLREPHITFPRPVRATSALPES